MKKMTLLSAVFALLICSLSTASAQKMTDDVHRCERMLRSTQREIIDLPNLDGYITLKGDFHTHTIFSDGEVMPRTRVNEAWEDGLDIIAITDHIEYRPFKDFVIGDLNTPYKMALEAAHSKHILVIPGTEITRRRPFGHMNALFVQDVNKLDTEDPLDAIDEAIKQGAFIFLNHPGWPVDSTTFFDVHQKLYREGKLHGVEVHNTISLYPKAVGWINEMNLTPFSNGDSHTPIHSIYFQEKLSRPMTFVFAKERSVESVHDALKAGRTIGWADGKLIGRAEWVEPFVRASLQVEFTNEAKSDVIITNHTDIAYTLYFDSHSIIIPAQKVVSSPFPTDGVVTVANAIVGLNQSLSMSWK